MLEIEAAISQTPSWQFQNYQDKIYNSQRNTFRPVGLEKSVSRRVKTIVI